MQSEQLRFEMGAEEYEEMMEERPKDSEELLNDHFDMNLGQRRRSIAGFRPTFHKIYRVRRITLSPQLSDTWHADELFVKMKGGGEREAIWPEEHGLPVECDGQEDSLLDCIHALQAPRTSEEQTERSGQRRENAHESLLKMVFTDGLNSYRRRGEVRIQGRGSCRKGGNGQAPRQQQS